MLGQPQPDQKQRIAEATANANDLSSLVKKKKAVKPSTTETATAATKPAEKRKLDDAEDGAAGVGKKAKVEEEKTEQVDVQKTV